MAGWFTCTRRPPRRKADAVHPPLLRAGDGAQDGPVAHRTWAGGGPASYT